MLLQDAFYTFFIVHLIPKQDKLYTKNVCWVQCRIQP